MLTALIFCLAFEADFIKTTRMDYIVNILFIMLLVNYFYLNSFNSFVVEQKEYYFSGMCLLETGSEDNLKKV
jgi:phosphatidylserine synthase